MCDRSYDEVVFDILKVEPDDFAVSKMFISKTSFGMYAMFYYISLCSNLLKISLNLCLLIHDSVETNYSNGYSSLQSYKT